MNFFQISHNVWIIRRSWAKKQNMQAELRGFLSKNSPQGLCFGAQRSILWEKEEFPCPIL